MGGTGFHPRWWWWGEPIPGQGSRETNPPRSGFYRFGCYNVAGNFRITKGYVVQTTDTTPPTAEIVAAFYRGMRSPPHDWWRKNFYVASNFTDNKGLACTLTRTGFWSEDHNRYIMTGWGQLPCLVPEYFSEYLEFIWWWPPPRPDLTVEMWERWTDPVKGAQRCFNLNSMVLGAWWNLGRWAACYTQGRRACKIEIRAIDRAGNEHVEPPKFFNIDWTPPVIEMEEITP